MCLSGFLCELKTEVQRERENVRNRGREGGCGRERFEAVPFLGGFGMFVYRHIYIYYIFFSLMLGGCKRKLEGLIQHTKKTQVQRGGGEKEGAVLQIFK